MTNDGPASPAQCLYCFEVLSAHFEGKEPPELAKVVQLYEEYEASKLATAVGQSGSSDVGLTAPVGDHHGQTLSPSSSSASTNATNTPSGSEGTTPARSTSRSPASLGGGGDSVNASYPVYVTWNTLSSRSGGKALRGCIGTFEAQPLAHGLRTYSLVSALEDYRFNPIPASLVPMLGCELTLLSNFEDCGGGVMDWEIGRHGLKISFVHRGRRMGATYLPHVCPEQGWDKEECVESLMCKAGWEPTSSGAKGVRKFLPGAKSSAAGGDGPEPKPWETVSDMKVVRYQGAHAAADYREWREWRAWAKGRI